ncbi:MAG: response regulator [Candidatus Gygaella obscura]|nr:response regulator [Candidatus Gygaella obscura]
MHKILMVDDDREFLEASKIVLEANDYEVILAENVSSAEAMIYSDKPDLIILDIMMEQPDDGIALAHKLKKSGIGIPVIMLSGVSTVTGYDYGECNEVLPCSDFLEKPVTPENLLNKIEKILKK